MCSRIFLVCLTTHTEIDLWSSENMISGRCFSIVILVIVFKVDAFIGSNHPRQPPPKEKIIISTGLYRRSSLDVPEDTTEVFTCLEDAYYFMMNSTSMINSTSNRYYDLRLYYLNQKMDRDKLRRSLNNYTCPMTMNLGNVNGHQGRAQDF